MKYFESVHITLSHSSLRRSLENASRPEICSGVSFGAGRNTLKAWPPEVRTRQALALLILMPNCCSKARAASVAEPVSRRPPIFRMAASISAVSLRGRPGMGAFPMCSPAALLLAHLLRVLRCMLKQAATKLISPTASRTATAASR